MQRNIDRASERIRESGHDPQRETFVIDCDASAKRLKWRKDCSPCITRSRCRGHWISNKERRFTIEEMFRLQGMDPSIFIKVNSASTTGQQLGNAMSVNVVERLLLQILKATGLTGSKKEQVDRWRSGEAIGGLSVVRSKRLCLGKRRARLRQMTGGRLYIVDSGASYHMIDAAELTDKELSTKRQLKRIIRLQTANGVCEVKEDVAIYVRELRLTVRALLSSGCPPILSLGKLCNEHRFRYVWNAEDVPYLKKGNVKVHCDPTSNVPFITESLEAPKDDRPAETQGKLKAKAKAKPKAKPKKKKDVRKTQVSKDAKHNIWTHFPKDMECEICRSCKTCRAHCRSREPGAADALPIPVNFADALTADHAIINEDDKSREEDRVALVILDRATQWLQSYATKTKNTEDTTAGFLRFLGPQQKAQHVYTDNSKEFRKSLKGLGISHDTATPHRPQTNGIAERAVRRVKEGTSCALQQSGFVEVWWAHAMMCFCFLRNIVDLLKSGNTAWSKRFGSNFKGPVIPFGAQITYKPIREKDKERLHKFGTKTLSGVFVGYDQQAGGFWSGDLKIVDQEELANAVHISDMHVKRFKANEVHVELDQEGEFQFPLAAGDWAQPELPIREQKQRRKRRRQKPAPAEEGQPSDG
ncbi:MAG: DNA cytosine methyltransferase, partial [Planctomycetota bacterium]|nr:DNA cytosine methyltransferase [Planctomycetota bacterium]